MGVGGGNIYSVGSAVEDHGVGAGEVVGVGEGVGVGEAPPSALLGAWVAPLAWEGLSLVTQTVHTHIFR